tara:strand:+ start:1228 stop:2088 length:861 start_codon:yes stop_codon:yes gene_type:complete
MPTIYITTSGFKNLTAIQTVKLYLKNDITGIELSGGKYTSENQIDKISRIKKTKLISIHNYFPPEKDPFILNLASFDNKILSRSIKKIKQNINYSKKINCKFYSFHAGFRIDPMIKDLGKKFTKNLLSTKDDAINNFLEQVKKINKYAKKIGIKLLIENNVFSNENYKVFNDNPFLLTNAQDINGFFSCMDKNVRLLMDTGHLKVSAKTEKKNLIKSLKSCGKYIGGYQLSDNDGLTDSNKLFSNKSWFVPYLKKDLDYYSIEVYDKNLFKLKSQISILKKIIYEK